LRVSQLVYATNDLEHALANSEQYGIPSFYRLVAQIFATVGDTEGQAELKVALANVRGVNIELMEATKDVGGFFHFGDQRHVGIRYCASPTCANGSKAAYPTGTRILRICKCPGAKSLFRKMFETTHGRLSPMIGCAGGLYRASLDDTPGARQEIDRHVPFHGDRCGWPLVDMRNEPRTVGYHMNIGADRDISRRRGF